MSCNLDHVLYNLQNASDKEKEDSWKFIKGGKHSLERYSNLGLCFLPSN